MPRKPSSRIEIVGDGTAKVELTRGLWATIDESDVLIVAPYKWRAKPGKKTMYAVRSDNTKNYNDYHMHRQIAGLGQSKLSIDHIDRDGLNNTRSNLRIANAQLQGLNMSQRSDCTTGVPGVALHHGKWRARVAVNGKRYTLGYYSNMADATHVMNTVNAIIESLLTEMIPTLEVRVHEVAA
jgi:hypothetical protein